MQPLTEAQRKILTSPSIEISAGCEVLNADLSFREDISGDLESGRVSRNMHATIHGTCDLRLSRSLVWGVDLVRPYMTVTDLLSGASARWNVGVFALTTPETVIGETPGTFDVQGFDRIMLLNRQVGLTYTVAAGTTYRAAILQAFTDAGLSGVLIDGAAADDTLPAAKSWPLVGSSTDPDQVTTPVTWLRVVNDLLTAINFRSVWADENGRFRCEAYRPPDTRAPEFTFDADSHLTILGEERTVTEDVWDVPNRWVFRQTNRAEGAPAPTEGDGIYTVVNQSDGPTSINSRGLTWTSVVDYEAASQAKLVSLGNRRVAADRRTVRRFDVTTGPLPAAGHFDVFEYRDVAAGGTRKVQAVSWQFDLSGSDVQWQWEAV